MRSASTHFAHSANIGDLPISKTEILLTASPRPEQNCKNDHPDYAPADPGDVRMGRLPFEDFLMDRH
jgi:hypothetical protein